LDLSLDEVMMGGRWFPLGKTVVLGVPAAFKCLWVKLMVLNYVLMWKDGIE
jgi:hypothetical protein